MRILMITIGYPPEQVGGTEVYVLGLVEALKQKGHECAVAYLEVFHDEGGPELQVVSREYQGANVHVIQVNSAKHKLEFIVFDPVLRAKLIAEFRKLVKEIRPDVVHVHPLQLGFDSYLIEALNQAGEKVLMTFHSSITTCARGDLLYMGAQVCDSLVLQDRCTKCLYHWKAVPAALAAPLSKLPVNWYRSVFAALADWPSLKKLRSFVSVPLIIEERRSAWTRTAANARVIVAVCEWVRDTIIKNGGSRERVIFSRHGLRFGAETNGHVPAGLLRFGYLGRVSPEKGIGVLLQVLKAMPPRVEYAFEFCSSSFQSSNRRPEEEDLVQAIYRLQKEDSRVRVLDDVGDNELRPVLAKWDAMVVPSLWLESGPQVIYEAFAVKTPILGSRLGGIAELVREGETGFLCAPNSVKELGALLRRFAERPADLRSLRGNIPPVRTTKDVAEDMLKVYQNVLANGAGSRSACSRLADPVMQATAKAISQVRHGNIGRRMPALWTVVRPFWRLAAAALTLGRGFRHVVNGVDTFRLTLEMSHNTDPFDWEPEEYRDVMSAIHEGDQVMDIGAFWGLFSLGAARRVGPNGRVIAIEPGPRQASMLKANLRGNNFESIVECVELVCADATGESVEFFVDPEGSMVDSAVAKPGRNARSVQRQTTTVDDLVNRFDLHPGVIKIDVEGFEDLVLKGARTTLRQYQPVLFVEFHHEELALRDVQSTDVLGFLENLGYECQELLNQSQTTIPRGHLFRFTHRAGAPA